MTSASRGLNCTYLHPLCGFFVFFKKDTKCFSSESDYPLRDMEEHIGISHAVRDTLGWSRGPDASRTQARKDFDQLCAEWALHQQQLEAVQTQETLAHGLRKTDSSTSYGTRSSRQHGHSVSPPTPRVKPWERVSRKMCVFAAWK